MNKGIAMRTILHRGGSVTVLCQVLPTGVLVQMDRGTWVHAAGKERPPELKRKGTWALPFKVKPGSVWVPNRELSKRTGATSKYMLCDDLYQALRQCFHVHGRYGAEEAHEGTERRDMREDVRNARAASQTFLQFPSLEEHEKIAFKTMLDQQAFSLTQKRDEQKRRAAQLFISALRTIDADRIGRPNPSAAAMQCGGGIGELLHRLRRITDLAEFVFGRGRVFGQSIEEAIHAYEALWSDVVSSSGPNRGIVPRSIRIIERSLQENASPEERSLATGAMDTMHSTFLAHIEALMNIQAQPFRRNAFHTLEDLRAAAAVTDPQKLDELKEILRRIKNGSRWVHCLNYLHLVLLMPVAMRVNFHAVVLSGKNRYVRKSHRTKLADYLKAASHDFEFVAKEIAGFEERMIKCADDDLSVPVKARVMVCLETAKTAVAEQDWLGVKRELTAISNIL